MVECAIQSVQGCAHAHGKCSLHLVLNTHIVSKQFLVYPVSRSWTSDVPPPLLPREKDPECATHVRRPPRTRESSDRGAEGTVDFFAGYVAQRRWWAFEQNRNLGKPSELAKLIMGALLNVIRKRAKQPINSPVCAAQCLMLSYGVPTCLHNVISCLLHVTASIASCYFVNACAHYVPTPLSHSARYNTGWWISGPHCNHRYQEAERPRQEYHTSNVVNWRGLATSLTQAGQPKPIRQFIDMAELLPDRLEVSANPQNTGEKEDQEASVTSILEWVQCFGIYIDVIAAKHPERIQDLLGYQALIIEACGIWLGYISTSAKQQLHHEVWYGLGSTPRCGIWHSQVKQRRTM